MQYLITFLEGIISFISPCMLPMLPVYISYFAMGADKKHKTFLRSLAFVIGFTVVFTCLGLFAGSLGSFLTQYSVIVNILCGIVIILFGLMYMDIIHLSFFKGMSRNVEIKGVLSAFLFGVVYSVSQTPCVGAFLGSAIMIASSSGHAIEGVLLLLTYSLGLGIPFLVSALLIEKLNSTFMFIKKHYNVINKVCGVFLIVIGILMCFGLFTMLISKL